MPDCQVIKLIFVSLFPCAVLFHRGNNLNFITTKLTLCSI